jgi:hypothetical protein
MVAMAGRTITALKTVIPIQLAILGAAALGIALGGCPDGPPRSISRGVRFLKSQQLHAPLVGVGSNGAVRDFPGDWPQYFYFAESPKLRFREVSPFTVTFIHEALTFITAENASRLGLSPQDVSAATSMRRNATAFVQSFVSRAPAPDADTYGFWPVIADAPPEKPLLSSFIFGLLQGPVLGGTRRPLNVGFYPVQLAIPSDADVTAAAYTMLLDDQMLGEGPPVDESAAHFFADWRDTGAIPRRFNPPWAPSASGAFLTWLDYRTTPDATLQNDVDPVVNVNVLYVLARLGKLDTPGVAEAISLIAAAVRDGYPDTDPEQFSLYYPDNLAFQYCVTRAYRRGPIAGLAGTVALLADRLESSAIRRADGTVYWNKGDAHLNTAFAVLSLLNAGRNTPLVANAVAYLQNEQRAQGSWSEGVFFFARTDGGPLIQWTSESFTTAMVLEALCQYRLQ